MLAIFCQSAKEIFLSHKKITLAQREDRQECLLSYKSWFKNMGKSSRLPIGLQTFLIFSNYILLHYWQTCWDTASVTCLLCYKNVKLLIDDTL